MSENVYRACRFHFRTHKHILFNSYLFDWESDLFTLTKSGYSIEVEVKISRADFLADFKKVDKHLLLSSHNKKHVRHRYRDYATDWGYDGGGKFHKLDGLACEVSFCDPKTKIPNRFYYACPSGLIKVDDLPPYAGLLWVDEKGHVDQVKQAPLLHKVKNIQESDLMDKYYWRIQNALSAYISFGSIDSLEKSKKLLKRIKQILL